MRANEGHRGLVELEQQFDVAIVTQNVDNLHERAGSTRVLHLHGELTKSRSTLDPDLVYEIDGWELPTRTGSHSDGVRAFANVGHAANSALGAPL